nr:LysR substrate-binding domain-containing protein [Stenotrophomonas maltophilia]
MPQVDLRTVATEALSDFDRDQMDIAVRMIRGPSPADLEARLLFRQELVAVASPHLASGLGLPLSLEQLRALPLLHDSHDHGPQFLKTGGKLPGSRVQPDQPGARCGPGGPGGGLGVPRVRGCGP